MGITLEDCDNIVSMTLEHTGKHPLEGLASPPGAIERFFKIFKFKPTEAELLRRNYWKSI
jgi:hypothetical protein